MLTRQEFLRSILMTSLGGALVAACGTDSGEPDPQPDAGGSADAGPFMGTCGSTSVQIGSNHSHIMMIEAGDVEAATTKEYDITGGADHPHTVRITAAQFATLKETGTLMVTSSNDGHSHSIRVRCLT
jgi:hypothetical protein